MLAVLVILVLAVWGLWSSWPRENQVEDEGADAYPDDQYVSVAPASSAASIWAWSPYTGPARTRSRFPGVPRLTEDDLIAFGLELESADDVVDELLDRRR